MSLSIKRGTWALFGWNLSPRYSRQQIPSSLVHMYPRGLLVYVFVLLIDSEKVKLAVRFARTKRGRNDLTKHHCRSQYCKEHLGT